MHFISWSTKKKKKYTKKLWVHWASWIKTEKKPKELKDPTEGIRHRRAFMKSKPGEENSKKMKFKIDKFPVKKNNNK